MNKKLNGFLMPIFLLCLCFTTALAQENKDSDRAKQQPELLVNADMEKVSSVIVKGMIEAGYNLDKESKYQLVFRKKVGRRNRIYGGCACRTGYGKSTTDYNFRNGQRRRRNTGFRPRCYSLSE